MQKLTPEIFQWTESGQELLIRFQIMIGEYGGRLLLADRIESEWTKTPLQKCPVLGRTCQGWTNKEVEIIKDFFRTSTAHEISVRLNRTESSVRGKTLSMQHKGLLTFKDESRHINRSF